jgi:type VII secretion protein EccB
LNLTSARLIAGRPDNPTTVKTSELDQFPRGNLIGIPGAPERMVQNTTRDADWTVCDGVSGPVTGVTLIAGPLDDGGERATALPADEAILVNSVGGPSQGTWLLWDGRRSPIDLADRAVTSALGLDADAPAPRSIAPGLFNAIPEAPARAATAIAGAGEPTRYPLPVPAPVGAVVVSYDADNTLRHYAVLADGLQPISPVVASILRNTNSFGLDQPPRLGADDVARLPTATGLDNGAYPGAPLKLVDAADAPLTCAQWRRAANATSSTVQLRSGVTLPVSDGRRTVALVGAGSGSTADRVALEPGCGYLVSTGGAYFWLTDTGVRYGLDDEKTIAALGLTPPELPIPWSMLSQFAPGPTLGRADALLAHDALVADPRPAVVRETPS